MTDEGDLFCGDLLINIGKPQFHSLIDNVEEAIASLKSLQTQNIHNIYPCHGIPFSINDLKQINIQSVLHQKSTFL